MTHYLLSNDTGTIIAKASSEVDARTLGMKLARESNAPVALHAIIAVKSAPVGGSVSMKGIMEWFT